MDVTNSVSDIMRAIRNENPDVDSIVLEGVHIDEDFWRLHLIGPIKWRVIVSFIDGDGYTTELFETGMEALCYTQERLAKWVEW